MEQKIKVFLSVMGLLVVGIIVTVFLRIKAGNAPAVAGEYDSFTTCLAEKGAVFYGAFWCPHCQAQKKLFNKSVKLLPYVECSTPDGKAQTQACIDKKIASYPTWDFADGSRQTGQIQLAQLAEKTSCALPGGEGAVPSTPVSLPEEGGSSPAQ